MTKAGKIILGVLIGLGSLISLALIAVLIVLNWPTLVLRPSVLQKISAYGPRFGVELNFSGASVYSTSYGFFDEGLSIHFTDLCVKYPPSLDKLCFSKARLDARYAFEGLSPRIKSLGPVVLEQGNLVYKPATQVPSDKKPITAEVNLPALRIPDMFKKTAFFPIDIRFDRLEFIKDDALYAGEVTIKGITTENHELERLEVVGKAIDESHGRSGAFSVAMDSPGHFKVDDWHVAMDANGDMGGGKKVKLKADFTKISPTGLKHSIEASIDQEGIKGDVAMAGELNEKEFTAVVNGKVLGLHKEVTEARLSQCRVRNEVTSIEKNNGHLTLNCPIVFRLKPHSLPSQQKNYYSTPAEAVLDVAVNANGFFYPDMEKPVQGNIRATLRPFKSGLVVTRGSAEVNLNGIPSKMPQDLNMVTHLDLDASIQDFSRLTATLGASAWAIPAPLNVLKGPVTLAVKGDIPVWKGERTFPIDFTTRLYSDKQKVDIDMKGQATVGFNSGVIKPSAELEVNLSDIKLELPTFTPPDIPQLIPDSRIRIGEKKKSKTDFDYHVKIKTPKPVQVVSNLVKTPIPITLDVDMTPGKITGKVSVGEFLVNLFRRDARVEFMELDLADPRADSALNGRVRVNYSDYRVLMLIQGTVDEPVLIFDSDPPLPQEDIIATLIYGEPPDALDTEQLDTVGQMSAAVADKALALSSLYLLASTPIERVHYNPQSRVFTARFRLGKGTSLSFGKGEDNYQVGLRRRLGKGWIINTSVENPSKDEDTDAAMKGSAFIEWHKRY